MSEVATVKMDRVLVDVTYGSEIVHVQAWKGSDLFEGEVQFNPAADEFLRKLSAKINRAYPGDGVNLNVKGKVIVREQ